MTSTTWRRRLALLCLVGMLAPSLAGCGRDALGTWPGGHPDGTPGSEVTPDAGASSPTDEATTAAADARLRPFYEQQVAWEDCDGAQCATFLVPLDYANPDGSTMKLHLRKVAATGPGGSDGSGSSATGGAASRHPVLMVTPDKAGSSAMTLTTDADDLVSPAIRKAFDIVGVDRRGTGLSSAISCVEAPKLDDVITTDPLGATPDTRAGVIAINGEMGQACQSAFPEVLPHVTTAEAARDMDIARAVLGVDKLNLLAVGDGGALAASYVGAFPVRSARVVLDGAAPPQLTGGEYAAGRTQALDRATQSFAKSCVSAGGCPLGDDVDSAIRTLEEMPSTMADEPAPVTGDPHITALLPGWGMRGLAYGLEDPQRWDDLTKALDALKEGSGTELFALAQKSVNRSAGDYGDASYESGTAIACIDRPAQAGGDDGDDQRLERFEKLSPIWGGFFSTMPLVCRDWPARSELQPRKAVNRGAELALVLGTTRDGRTPYEWSQQLTRDLGKARLITRDADGHGAYHHGSACVDKAVDAYLLQGRVPGDGVRC